MEYLKNNNGWQQTTENEITQQLHSPILIIDIFLNSFHIHFR